MRKITHIAIHCTATSQNTRVESIQRYWRETLKWRNPGYHYMIDPTGRVHALLPEDRISNGVAGWNTRLINLSYIGGVDQLNRPIDNRTPPQRQSMLNLLRELKRRYPHAIIQGHRDFPNVKKDCPSFDAKREYAHL